MSPSLQAIGSSLLVHQTTIMHKLLFVTLVLCTAPLLSEPAQAAVHVPSIIGDNMVVQQGVKARLWGTAEPGENVTVTMGTQIMHGQADAKGHWQVFLNPLKAGGPFVLTIAGRDRKSTRL